MKLQLAAICLAIGTLLVPLAARAADADSDRAHPSTYVKDSVITTKIARIVEEPQVGWKQRLPVRLLLRWSGWEGSAWWPPRMPA